MTHVRGGTQRRSGPGGRRAAFLVALASLGCSGSDPVEPDPAVAPFVGTWDAEAMTLEADAPSTAFLDVIGVGGSFTITIEPSGAYTAALQVSGFGGGEVGQLIVDDATLAITIDPTTPPGPAITGEYSFQADDYLVIEGATEYAFGTGTNLPSQLHMELQRR